MHRSFVFLATLPATDRDEPGERAAVLAAHGAERAPASGPMLSVDVPARGQAVPSAGPARGLAAVRERLRRDRGDALRPVGDSPASGRAWEPD